MANLSLESIELSTPFNKEGVLDAEHSFHYTFSSLPIIDMLREGMCNQIVELINSGILLPNSTISVPKYPRKEKHEPALLAMLMSDHPDAMIIADALWEKGAFFSPASWDDRCFNPASYSWINARMEAVGFSESRRGDIHKGWLLAQLNSFHYEQAFVLLDLPLPLNLHGQPDVFSHWVYMHENLVMDSDRFFFPVINRLLDRYAEQKAPLPTHAKATQGSKAYQAPIAYPWFMNLAFRMNNKLYRSETSIAEFLQISRRLLEEFDVDINGRRERDRKTVLHLLTDDPANFSTTAKFLREMVILGADPFLVDGDLQLPGRGTVLDVVRQEIQETQQLTRIAKDPEIKSKTGDEFSSDSTCLRSRSAARSRRV